MREYWAGILNNVWGPGTEKDKVVVPARQAALAGEIESLESVPRLLKSLKIGEYRFRSSCSWYVQYIRSNEWGFLITVSLSYSRPPCVCHSSLPMPMLFCCYLYLFYICNLSSVLLFGSLIYHSDNMSFGRLMFVQTGAFVPTVQVSFFLGYIIGKKSET